jgi:hypothetical protein
MKNLEQDNQCLHRNSNQAVPKCQVSSIATTNLFGEVDITEIEYENVKWFVSHIIVNMVVNLGFHKRWEIS